MNWKMSIRHWCLLGLLATFTAVIGLPTQAQTIEDVIPGDSLLYVKLQNLQACRKAIETSENWKKTADIISALPKWQAMNQFMQMLPMLVGTDVHGLIQTFLSGGLALTVAPGTEGLMVGIVLEDKRNRVQDAEQTFAKLIETVSGTEGNHVQIHESEYRKIKYSTAKINEQQFTYGRINETLFLVGITPGSFKKMIDTYKTEGESIVDTTLYRSAAHKFEKREVFAFMNMEQAAPFMKFLLPPPVSAELELFRTLVCSWNVLSPGGSLQVYGQTKAARQDTFISRLQENATMQTIQGMSGEEGFFLAVAPATANTISQMIEENVSANTQMDTDTETSTAEGVFSLLIPHQTDVLGAVAGELAISGEFSTFYRLEQAGTRTSLNLPDGIIEFDFPKMELGLIFNPEFPSKWQAFFSGLLENLTIDSHSQFDYKGITFNAVSIPGTLFYGNVNQLFVLAFSEKHVKSIVDNVLTGKGKPFFKRRLEQLPARPAFLLQVSLDEYLSLIATEEEAAMFSKKIDVLQASLVVQEGEAWLEMKISPEEKAIDAVALLAPVIFLEVFEIPFAQ